MNDKVPISLAPVLLTFSCTNKWSEMDGDQFIRACSQCECTVENISNFSKHQVIELQQRIDAGEKICVAFKTPIATKIKEIEPHFYNSINYAAPDNNKLKNAKFASLSTLGISVVLASTITLSSCSSTKSAKHIEATKMSINDLLPKQQNCRKGDEIILESKEYAMSLGRPAPNQINSLVSKVRSYALPKNSGVSEALINSFEINLDKGHISIAELETLAEQFHRAKQITASENCYVLLLALADERGAKPERIAELKNIIKLLETEEFEFYLQQCDEAIAKADFQSALSWLTSANAAVFVPPIYNPKWKQIARRVDQIEQSPFDVKHDPVSLFALQAAKDFPPSSDLEKWKKAQRALAHSAFNSCLLASPSQPLKADYIGRIDSVLRKQVDWNLLMTKLHEQLLAPDDFFYEQKLSTAKQLILDGDLGTRTKEWRTRIGNVIDARIAQRLKFVDENPFLENKLQPFDTLGDTERLWRTSAGLSSCYTWNTFATRYLAIALTKGNYNQFSAWSVLFDRARENPKDCLAEFSLSRLRESAIKEWHRAMTSLKTTEKNHKTSEQNEQLRYCQSLLTLDSEVNKNCKWEELAEIFWQRRLQAGLFGFYDLAENQPVSKSREKWIGKFNDFEQKSFKEEMLKARTALNNKDQYETRKCLSVASQIRSQSDYLKAHCSETEIQNMEKTLIQAVDAQ